MKSLSCSIAVVLLLNASTCMAAEEEANPEPDAVQVRIANVSEVPFGEVVIVFPGHEEDYGSIEPGRVSEYRTVSLAFPYPAYSILAGGKPYRAITADHMGDTRLKTGSYTYTIDIFDERLIFGLIIDED